MDYSVIQTPQMLVNRMSSVMEVKAGLQTVHMTWFPRPLVVAKQLRLCVKVSNACR